MSIKEVSEAIEQISERMRRYAPVGDGDPSISMDTIIEAFKRCELVFEHAPIGIVIADAKGYLIEVNQLFSIMLGYETEEIRSILLRTLPKMISIELDLAEDLGKIKQIEMNLCINASHAMPDGGRLGIKTENVSVGPGVKGDDQTPPSGDYVLLSVSDTGIWNNDSLEMDRSDCVNHSYLPPAPLNPESRHVDQIVPLCGLV